MQLQSIPVNDLLPAPYNPRVPLQPGDRRWKKLERSLAEFDLVQPIVWNRRTGHVVGGHQRLEILKFQGHAAVDCVVVDLPSEREKLLNVTLNNAEVGSDWEPDKLLNLISELVDLPDVDATLTGFDPQELRDLLLSPGDQSPETSADLSEQGHIRCQLDVPKEQWDAIEGELNGFLQRHPDVRLHVRQHTTR